MRRLAKRTSKAVTVGSSSARRPWEMFTEDAPQLHSLDGAVEQWQGADVIGAEFEAVGLSVPARDDLPFGATWCGR